MKLKNVIFTIMSLICLVCAIVCFVCAIQANSYWAIFWIIATSVDALDFWACLKVCIQDYKNRHNKAP